MLLRSSPNHTGISAGSAFPFPHAETRRVDFFFLPPVEGEQERALTAREPEPRDRTCLRVRNLLVIQAKTQREVLERAARGFKACQPWVFSYHILTAEQAIAHYEAPADIC